MAESNRRATLLGFGAVLMWSTLAAFTVFAGKIPPFQLTAMTFVIGTCVGLVFMGVTGQSLLMLKTVPLGAYALGVYGLLGFHTCYFFALQNAPPLEVSLIVYLWPLLIVLFTGLLPGRDGSALRWWHMTGAGIGFAGTALILLGGTDAGPVFASATSGALMAFLAAVIWATYSVASRLYAGVPSSAVVASCAATAVGAALLHLALETTVMPAGLTGWLAIVALGLGPVGIAFYIWDEGMKRGDIRLLGVASYLTPLVSTVLLAVLGLGKATATLWIAAGLIVGGALLASADKLRRG